MNRESNAVAGLRIATVGHTLAVFLVITYLLCVLLGILVPSEMRMYEAWAPLLPGFKWLTLPGFLFGLIGAYLYGWYIAVIIVPVYGFFAGKA